MLYHTNYVEAVRQADQIRKYWLARGYFGIETRVERRAPVRDPKVDEIGDVYAVRSNIGPTGFPPAVLTATTAACVSRVLPGRKSNAGDKSAEGHQPPRSKIR